ncbi:hypothetical protein ACFQNE_12910 [Gordonia phosphorivorans]|uniref:Integral membrane protein n=1 Tax=Gordonia phosphorivorans TaxID=1056982 RepID=A0ABV6H615_9ACTN
MRSLLTGLFLVVAVLGMIVAVPSTWVTTHVVSVDGFADTAARAASKPEVQEFFAAKIADEVAQSTDIPLAGSVVAPLAQTYTRSPAFVTDFTEVARQQHGWLFTAPAPDTSRHVMELDVTPMVNRVLESAPVPIRIDREITVPLDQTRLTAGSLESSGSALTLTAWISVIGAALAAVVALLLARNRAAILAWLGVGAVVAGGAGAALAIYLRGKASESATGDLSSRHTATVVADEVLAGLTTTSWIVGAVGLAVAVVGAAAAVVLGRR